MISTRIYIACESPALKPLKDAAQLIALQKGCDPIRVPWPTLKPRDSGESREKYQDELWVCQKQFREIVPTCDLFVAIVDGKYGKHRVRSPHASKGVSPLHFELLEVNNIQDGRPRVDVYTLAVEQVPAVQRMLSTLDGSIHKLKFNAEKQFRRMFSVRLTEFRQEELARHLATLHRVRFSVTCPDERGLIARVAQVIGDLGGSLAFGTQSTKGRFAVLHFVGEWVEDSPNPRTLRERLSKALPNKDTRIEADELPVGRPEMENLLTVSITFVDQPGIAEHVFTTILTQNWSVLNTRIETSLSGGLMLGRIDFSLNADGLPPESQSLFAADLGKLPGILHVDRNVRRGRFWS